MSLDLILLTTITVMCIFLALMSLVLRTYGVTKYALKTLVGLSFIWFVFFVMSATVKVLEFKK